MPIKLHDAHKMLVANGWEMIHGGKGSHRKYTKANNAFIYNDNTGYSVIFPDLEYGVTQGDTLDDAIYMARNYLETYFDGENIADVPKQKTLQQSLEQLQQENLADAYDGELVCIIPITAHVQERCKRLNITLPERLISAVDAVARTVMPN